MGAKTWMLVYADGNVPELLKVHPSIDRDATLELAQTLFPSETLTPIPDGTLCFTNPPDDEIYIACFPGVSIVAAKEFGLDYPSHLDPHFLTPGANKTTYLHAMHSVVDWLAFAQWTNGRLIRALSLSPDSGVMEDIGARLPFEEPFWKGLHPAIEPEAEDEDEYPLPFHPLEMGEEVLKEFFGYQLEGFLDAPAPIDPEQIPLARFKRTSAAKPWWKLWQ